MTLTHPALIKLGPTHNAHHTGLTTSARTRQGVEMAAAAQQVPIFTLMSEAALRHWVEANPGRVNDRDSGG
jgi:hypothetical protein